MAGPQTLTAAEGRTHLAFTEGLLRLFYPTPCALGPGALGTLEAVSADETPAAYRGLLAHDDHMTVALEAHHDSLVKVRVLDELDRDDAYARKSLLARQSDGAVVQLGVMRIGLKGLPANVAEGIRSHVAPLGRLLIRNNLLREVELLALWRIVPAEELREVFRLPEGEVVYGRTARILVAGRPAVEMVEIPRL